MAMTWPHVPPQIFKFKTPKKIPEKIKNIRVDGYKNIFDFESNPFADADHPNLWGTETLFGDWDGKLLIVLKDFSSTEFLKNRSDNRPIYSHAPNNRTNQNLVSFLKEAGYDTSSEQNTSCGILYISACFLMRCGSGLSGRISPRALRASWDVIDFTISKMPNLTDIALCGREAFDTFNRVVPFDHHRAKMKNADSKIRWEFQERIFYVHVTCHPSSRGINSNRDRVGQGRTTRQVSQDDWNKIVMSAFKSNCA
jgi:hypothetical protein